jgi:hypothetical protein
MFIWRVVTGCGQTVTVRAASKGAACRWVETNGYGMAITCERV